MTGEEVLVLFEELATLETVLEGHVANKATTNPAWALPRVQRIRRHLMKLYGRPWNTPLGQPEE